MRLKLPIRVMLVAFALSGAICRSQLPQSEGQQQQEIYGNDFSFRHPIHLSEDALRVLVASKMAGYARDWAKEHPGGDLNQFFRAVQVQLSDSKGSDYVVEGQFPLTGADCNWYWVIHAENGRLKVVLFDNTDFIQLLTSETNGLKDIQTIWQSPSETDRKVFHFNGKQYMLVSRKWEERSGR